jgi:tRNA(Arg) A34 adenosine deaminase TadA
MSHEKYMRRANQLAVQAAKKGNHPFGAVLVYRDEIIAEAENTIKSDMDFTRHAELNLVVKASNKYDREVLSESTLYASTAPCIMCAAAIKDVGITRVVYGVKYETFAEQVPGPYRYVSIEDIYKLLGKPLEAFDGVLEEECLDSYEHWPKKSKHPS